MALIECKYCGKQVSDKAKACPNCGNPLIPDVQPEPVKCPECGCEIPEGAASCPNCGCPIDVADHAAEPQKVEITKVSMPVDKNKVRKIVGVAVAVIAVIAVILIGTSVSKRNQAEKAAADYAGNFDLCVSSMYLGAVNAESAGGLIHDVWYNTIYEEKDYATDKYTRKSNGSGSFYDDFNDSLSNLFSDSAFTSKISDIRTNQDLVASLMKELKNPPEEYADAYDALKDLYEVYSDLTECAVNPSGNLSSYTSTFNTADSDFVKYYKAVNMYQ